MPLRGESVGTAYVRILADGSGLPESIREEMRDGEPAMRSSGEEHGAAYSEGFLRELNKEDNDPTITVIERLHRGVGKFDAEGKRGGDIFNASLRRELEKAFPNDVGTRIFKSLEESFSSGNLDVKKLEDTLDNIRPAVAKATKDITRETDLLEKEWRKDFDAIDADTKRSIRGITSELGRMRSGLSSVDGRLGGLRSSLKSYQKEVLSSDEGTHHFSDRMRNFATSLDDVGAKLGKVFGKGSRNNFLNFIGVLVGGLGSVPGAITRYSASLSDGTTSLASFGGLLAKTGGGIIAIVGLFSIMAAAASGLAAAITALASSLAFALIGAIAPLAGLLPVVIGGLGVVGLAFVGLDAKTKKLVKESLKPLTDQLKELGGVAREGLFSNIQKQTTLLSTGMGKLKPLVKAVAKGLSDATTIFLRGFKSKSFDNFVIAMTQFLPDATESLARSLRHTFGGLGGLFQALIPLTTEFLGWLEKITGEFSDFANSAEGQNKLKDFFDKAGESARAVGDVIGATGRLLGTLFDAGKQSGDNIFESLAKNIDKFNKSLKTGAGQDTLHKWFEDGKNLADQLGDLVVGVGKVIGAFNNPSAQKALDLILGTITNLLNFIGDHEHVAVALGAALIGVGTALIALKAVTTVVTGFQSLNTAMEVLGATSATTTARMSLLKAGIAGAALTGGLLLFNDSANRTSKSMGVLQGAAAGAIGGAGIGAFAGPEGAAVGAAIGGLVGGVAAFARGNKDAESTLKSLTPKLKGYADTLDGVSGALTKATRARVLDNLASQDAISKGHALGLSTKVLIDAALGIPSAMNKVRDTTTAANAALAGAKFHFTQNGEVVASMTAKQREAAKGATALADAIGFTAEKTHADVIANRDRLIQLGQYKKLLPGIKPKVATQIDLLGLEGARSNIIDLTHRYNLTPKQVTTILKAADVNPTKAQVQSIIDKAKELDRQRPRPRVGIDGVADTIRSIQSIINGIAKIKDKSVHITVFTNANVAEAVSASGRLVTGPMRTLVGEAGPEAIVPLNRPLWQVDPSVRWLSAIAQGKTFPGVGEGRTTNGKVVNVGGINVTSNAEDPEAVANQVLNALVGVGY